MNKRILTGLSVILVFIMITGCAKDKGNPSIKFVAGTGFTGKDAIIKVADTLVVQMEIGWNGVDKLKQLESSVNDGSPSISPLSGDSILAWFTIIKGVSDLEKWTFVVKDEADNQSSITLNLTRDPNSEYGAILYFAPVSLGAQNNTTKGGFIGFPEKSATIYTLESAFSNQANVGLLYYSDLLTHATLASPGSDIPADLFPGARNISLWTIKNASRFMKSTLTAAEFSAISTDAPIVKPWKDALSVSSAGELKVNDVWLVSLASGRKGAILVKGIVGADAGELQFEIKIQD